MRIGIFFTQVFTWFFFVGARLDKNRNVGVAHPIMIQCGKSSHWKWLKFLQNAYLANTKRIPKTEFWTCFGTWVPPFRAGVYGAAFCNLAMFYIIINIIREKKYLNKLSNSHITTQIYINK